MRTNILVILLLAIGCMGLSAQNADNLLSAKEKTITLRMTESSKVEEGWVHGNNAWYYYGSRIMVTPVSYSIIETIDSTYISGGKEINTVMEMHEESSGSYQTSEEGWSWTGKRWTFEGDTVHAYPSSFIRKAKVEKKTVKNEEVIAAAIDESEEQYQVEDQNWSWDTRKKIWRYNNEDVDKLPEYKVVRSKVTSRSLNIN